ncbi:MAG: hypothetical protein U0X93_08800 [Anaerolineales bacterium]
MSTDSIRCFTHRQRRTDEVFPWEHITAAVRKNFLFQDFRQSLEGEGRVDCPTSVVSRAASLGASRKCARKPDVWKCGELKSPSRKVIPQGDNVNEAVTSDQLAVNSLPVVGD